MSTNMNFRVPIELKEAFVRACEENFTNQTEVLKRAMLDYARRNQKEASKMTEVVIIEAGENYTERLEAFKANIATVDEAIVEVESRGYTVIPNTEGGQNGVADGYIAITVEPK